MRTRGARGRRRGRRRSRPPGGGPRRGPPGPRGGGGRGGPGGGGGGAERRPPQPRARLRLGGGRHSRRARAWTRTREPSGAPATLPRAPRVLAHLDLYVVGVRIARAVRHRQIRAVLPRLRVGVLRVRLVRVGRVVAELPGGLERRPAALDD